MKKVVYLKIDTIEGIITIPFLGIEEVDNFTIIYNNINELGNRLIKLLKLPIKIEDIVDIYLSYDKYNMGRDNKCFNIKYRYDNFNIESLKVAFANYLKDDPKRIFMTDIRYVKTAGILRYFDSGIIDGYEIDNAVRVFFAPGTGYKRKRDIYFLIKDEVFVDVDEVTLKYLDKVDRSNLSSYSKGEDDYLSYLVEYSKKGELEYEKVMDEIGQSDLEDISRFLHRSRMGIVDGASNEPRTMDMEIMVLEENTGLSIENLRTNNTSFGRRRRHR